MYAETPKLVLIDLDGTLVDTVPDLAYAIDSMMSQLELPQRGEEKVRQWIGNGIERLVKRALLDGDKGYVDEESFQSALHLFKVSYDQVNGRNSKLYEGVQDGLDWLKSQDIPLVCITNKAEQFSVPLLKALDIHDYFRLVISGDTLPQKKPDPMPLLHAAKFCGVDPHAALMLGDSISDVQAARAAEFKIICVNYGYNHGLDISDSNPDAVIDSLAQLVDFIK
ncbi:MAG: phosphoglycolate phosphatase [Candidatus Parabeggiatoa sp. nov. 3]|nr:MAG: phosphoglycolate phosphatase [Gammaproteobacteria bacterium]RKZ68240.1 MAG: phosphoglycolate phosphatase [Gammaproteobacteria bacterium]RKZ78124.1 MAG: phosphoglycolate phosphatase [Gammaproteobacteria bacterium]HEW98387.1 phosphoglycolate phosphatase [Beggiatoa sp.]